MSAPTPLTVEELADYRDRFWAPQGLHARLFATIEERDATIRELEAAFEGAKNSAMGADEHIADQEREIAELRAALAAAQEANRHYASLAGLVQQ